MRIRKMLSAIFWWLIVYPFAAYIALNIVAVAALWKGDNEACQQQLNNLGIPMLVAAFVITLCLWRYENSPQHTLPPIHA